jgi:hypothetical protein
MPVHPHVISVSAIGLLVLGATTAKPVVNNVKQAIEKHQNINASSAQVTALRRAIIGQESNHQYNLVNPHSGALGYAQLMPANVRPWTKEALGYAMDSREFLSNQKAQIKTIDFKLNEYLRRELAQGHNEELTIRRVASAWYSGQPRLWNNTRPQYYGGARYPSIENYTRSVWRKYLKEKAKLNK